MGVLSNFVYTPFENSTTSITITHKCSLVPHWGSYIMKSTKRCHKKGLNKANEGTLQIFTP